MDRTIRIWEVATGTCGVVISAAGGGNGHSEAVTCLEVIPPVPPHNKKYIASGGADKNLKLWEANGELTHCITHDTMISALGLFQDAFGGKNIFSQFLQFLIYLKC